MFTKTLSIPIYSHCVPAGFPSPAEDYIEDYLDFNVLLIENPMATFALRVKGSSMKDAGILDGSIIIVDRSVTPQHKDPGVFVLDGEQTVKYLYHAGKSIFLVPANTEHKWIEVKSELVTLGRVMWVVHQPLRMFNDVRTR